MAAALPAWEMDSIGQNLVPGTLITGSLRYCPYEHNFMFAMYTSGRASVVSLLPPHCRETSAIEAERKMDILVFPS